MASDWIEVYNHKSCTPDTERWACRRCESVVDASHKSGPPDGVCKCSRCKSEVGSEAYRRNYEMIRWTSKKKSSGN